MKEAIIEDEELGRLIVRVNLRAKSLVFRTKSDAVYVSVPSGTTMKEVKRAIEDLRSKLLASRQRLNRPLIDLNYKIEAEFFKLSLVSTVRCLLSVSVVPHSSPILFGTFHLSHSLFGFGGSGFYGSFASCNHESYTESEGYHLPRNSCSVLE